MGKLRFVNRKIASSVNTLFTSIRGDTLYCSVIVPAAGLSSRFLSGDKLWAAASPDGAPILSYTLRALNRTPEVGEIVVAARPEQLEQIQALAAAHGIEKFACAVPGGDTRAESVQAALGAVSHRAVLVGVHDAARPLATPELIGAVIRRAAQRHAAIAAVPVKDTIKTVQRGMISATPDRHTLYAAQTPQVFDRYLLEAAYAAGQGTPFTDDASAVEAMGISVYIVSGEYENIKITTGEDLLLLREIIKRRDLCASDTDTTSTG